MKHDKKHKKNKSPKRSKKSKKSDRKEKKHKHKEKKKNSKKLEKALKSSKEIPAKIVASQSSIESSNPLADEEDYCGPSIDLMNKAKCPTTKWEHDQRQKSIKRIVDPETGRIRLIKGDGEILEEIVSRNRHKQINQEATRNDGATFQKNTVGTTRK